MLFERWWRKRALLNRLSTKRVKPRAASRRLGLEYLETRWMLDADPLQPLPDPVGSTVQTTSAIDTTSALVGTTSSSVGQTVTYTATVSTSSGNAASGTVSFLDGSTVLGTADVDGTGVAKFSTVLTTKGAHVISAVYGGNATYNASTSSSINLNLAGLSGSLGLSYSTPLANQPLTINARIYGTVLGTVPRSGTLSLLSGTTTLASVDLSQTAPSASGYYALRVAAGLPIGSNVLQVSYSGDTTYNGATSSVSLNILNDGLSMSYSTTALTGRDYTVKAAITGPLEAAQPRTGTLSLLEGTSTLASIDVASTSPASNGYYSLTVAGGLSLGAHNLKVSYSGDGVYTPVSAILSKVTAVDSVNTTTSLSGSTSVSLGQTPTYTAYVYASGLTVSGGNVTFYDGTTQLGVVPLSATGSASYQAAGLTVGSHALRAVYSGGSGFNTSSSNSLNVTIQGVSTYVANSWSTPLAGVSLTINSRIYGSILTNTPRTGTLTLDQAGTVLASVNIAQTSPNASGYYALTVPAGLPAGSNVLKVTYSGDANYKASSSTLTLDIRNNTLALQYGTTAVVSLPYTVKAAINGALVNATARTGTLSLVEGSTTRASVDLGTTAPNSSGYYALTVADGLPLGSHVLKVVYSGDSVYTPSTYNMATVNAVSSLATTTSLSGSTYPTAGQTVTYTARVYASGVTVNAGSVTFSDGATVLGTVNVNDSGVATFSTSALAIGSHSIRASYSGTSAFIASASNVINATVQGGYTSVLPSYSIPMANQAFTLNARLSGSLINATPRTGTLALVEGTATLASLDISAVQPNSSGYYALSVPSGFAAGSHSLKVIYSGDALYSSTTSNVTLNIVNTSLTLSYSSVALTSQDYTSKVRINGALVNNTPRTGTLSLVEGGSTLASLDVAAATPDSNGYYSLTLSGGLSAGSHPLKVVYSGDANYSASTYNMATVTAGSQLPTYVSPSFSSTVPAGQTAYFYAWVYAGNQGVNTGSVTFSEAGTTLATVPVSASGFANFSTNTLAIGSHTITAAYSGAETLAPSSKSATTTVLNTSLNVAWSSSALVDQTTTWTVGFNGPLINSTPRTGTLSLVEGTTTLASVDVGQVAPSSSGTYVLTVAGGLSLGSHNVKVVYSGDSSYNSFTYGPYTHNVVSSLNTYIYLSSAPLSVLSGQTVNYSAYVYAPGAPSSVNTGTITFRDGSTVLATVPVDASGRATYSTSALALGSHAISVTYDGSSAYKTSTSSNYTTTVSNTTVAFGSVYSTGLVNQPATWTAKLNGSLLNNTPRTGTLSLVDGSTTITSIDITQVSPNSSGYYSLSVAGGLSLGSHSIKIVYSGDANYSSISTGTYSHTVVATTNTYVYLQSYAGSITAGQMANYTAYVYPSGVPSSVTSGTITFRDGSTVLATVPVDATGHATYGTNQLSMGNHPITVSYDGTGSYNASTSSTYTTTVSNTTVAFGSLYSQVLVNQPATWTAKLNGSLIDSTPRTGTLSLVEGSTTLASIDLAQVAPNSSGYYSLSFPSAMSVGSHSVKIVYSGDALYSSASTSTYSYSVLTSTNTYVYLQSAPSSAILGQTVNYTAYVYPTSVSGTVTSGTITFRDGSTVLATVPVDATGHATYGTNQLTMGSHSLTVSYDGTATHRASTSSTYTTTVTNTTLTVGSYDSNLLAGAALNYTAKINGTIGSAERTGTLSLLDGATTLASLDISQVAANSNGYYSLSLANGLPAGSHSLKIVYSGDANYSPASFTLSGGTAYASLPTSTYFYGYSSLPTIGQTATYYVRTYAQSSSLPVNSGVVTLYDGSTVLGTANVNASGQASFSVVFSQLGARTLTATYQSEGSFNTSTTSALAINVVNTLIGSASYASAVYFAAPYSVSASLTGVSIPGTPRTGTVSLVEGTTTLASVDVSTMTSSSFSLTLANGLPAGAHSLKLVYSGDANYNTASYNLGTVNSTTTMPVNFSVNFGTTAANAPYAAKLLLSGSLLNNAARTGTLSLVEGSTTVGSIDLATAIPDANGYYTIPASQVFSAGWHYLKFVYSGDANYAAKTSGTYSVNFV